MEPLSIWKGRILHLITFSTEATDISSALHISQRVYKSFLFPDGDIDRCPRCSINLKVSQNSHFYILGKISKFWISNFHHCRSLESSWRSTCPTSPSCSTAQSAVFASNWEASLGSTNWRCSRVGNDAREAAWSLPGALLLMWMMMSIWCQNITLAEPPGLRLPPGRVTCGKPF